jgi:hypothetical protein
MKLFARVAMLFGLLAVICLPGIAMADFTLSSIGTYWSDPGGSILFDRFETYYSGAATFSGAAVNDSAATIGYRGSFSSAGWTGEKISDTVSRAFGPAVTTLNWDYNFSGGFASLPQRFDINYFKGDTFIGHEGYSITAYQTYQGGFDKTLYAPVALMAAAAPVPIPAAGWLLGAGLICLVGVRRRVR